MRTMTFGGDTLRLYRTSLACFLATILPGQVTAQTCTTLHSFTAGGYDSSGHYRNSDGANPLGGLILSGNTLYGTAQLGGTAGVGTVFAINADGADFTTLGSFAGYPSGGGIPEAGL